MRPFQIIFNPTSAAELARMPKELFEAGYPRLAEFIQYRDPGISSGLSRRLMGR